MTVNLTDSRPPCAQPSSAGFPLNTVEGLRPVAPAQVPERTRQQRDLAWPAAAASNGKAQR